MEKNFEVRDTELQNVNGGTVGIEALLEEASNRGIPVRDAGSACVDGSGIVRRTQERQPAGTAAEGERLSGFGLVSQASDVIIPTIGIADVLPARAPDPEAARLLRLEEIRGANN